MLHYSIIPPLKNLRTNSFLAIKNLDFFFYHKNYSTLWVNSVQWIRSQLAFISRQTTTSNWPLNLLVGQKKCCRLAQHIEENFKPFDDETITDSKLEKCNCLSSQEQEWQLSGMFASFLHVVFFFQFLAYMMLI
jgi:hypothetical protein